MALQREITNPFLSNGQEPTMISFRRSLRSPSPCPLGPTQSTKTRSRSRTRTSENTLDRSLQSRTPSPVLNRSGSYSNLRKSTRKLSSSLNNSAELENIESDYIKNLQQQIYFLELEANYLRDQASKATAMHPKMTAEAEQMLTKLRSFQNKIDSMNLEVVRKEASLQLANNEKQKAFTCLEEEELKRQRENRVMMEEIVDLKNERDRIRLQNRQTESKLDHVSTDKDRLALQLADAEETIALLKEQLDTRVEQHKMSQLEIEELRTHVLRTESRAREVEEEYLTNTALQHEKTVNEFKDNIRSLKRQLKEAKLKTDEDIHIRSKMQEEHEHLVMQKSVLNQQITELERLLQNEMDLRESSEVRKIQKQAEVSLLCDKIKELEIELRLKIELLAEEKTRSARFADKLNKQENLQTSLELTNTKHSNKLLDAETRMSSLGVQNSQLRKDKQILIEHVADLQKQIANSETNLSWSQQHIVDLEKDLDAADHEKVEKEMRESQKWKEFETLADSMKSLTRTMARSSSPPRVKHK